MHMVKREIQFHASKFNIKQNFLGMKCLYIILFQNTLIYKKVWPQHNFALKVGLEFWTSHGEPMTDKC